MDKRRREIIRLAKRYGFKFRGVAKRRAHLRFRHRKTGYLLVTACSASDWRGIKNLEAEMKRYVRTREAST